VVIIAARLPRVAFAAVRAPRRASERGRGGRTRAAVADDAVVMAACARARMAAN
jgi:hypothetical protein